MSQRKQEWSPFQEQKHFQAFSFFFIGSHSTAAMIILVHELWCLANTTLKCYFPHNRVEPVALVGETQGKRSSTDWWLCLMAMTLLPSLNWILPRCRRPIPLSLGKWLQGGQPNCFEQIVLVDLSTQESVLVFAIILIFFSFIFSSNIKQQTSLVTIIGCKEYQKGCKLAIVISK